MIGLYDYSVISPTESRCCYVILYSASSTFVTQVILTTPPVCPNCSNMLIVARTPSTSVDGTDDPRAGQNRFECRSCPYAYALERRFYEQKFYEGKKAEDVVGGEESIKDRQKINSESKHFPSTQLEDSEMVEWDWADEEIVQCTNQKCDSNEALFYQLQIRSADEPMTNFYRCVKCSTQWRD